jgi:dsDNA-specific endonuclease/ATPase MutS2
MSEDVHPLPIDEELDLHTFRADDCADVVDEYLRAAHEAGLRSVRVVHGKGTGAMRATVHAVLERSELVARYRLDDANWGATIVELVSP